MGSGGEEVARKGIIGFKEASASNIGLKRHTVVLFAPVFKATPWSAAGKERTDHVDLL